MLCKLLTCGVVFAAIIASSGAVRAGEADVVDARVTRDGDGRYRFLATVEHTDAGWDHYADLWEVRAPGGTVLGSRTLLHPHVDEQPFTRSLSGVVIPEGVQMVEIHARDSVHGFGGAVFTLEIPR
ncbi:hypothetical protein [Futiania mangrovi]|uniref:Uncharacterized protein n=1 Tax=Futiania mangrovi TaxID=2959716 RepID=A0A9J6P9N7_9PROT|nr:hypothetical protein [Futiania mangrovii]MCP1335613.1 hypothetical protein [Futiania mangrovii]